jgi:hypothetical protein
VLFFYPRNVTEVIEMRKLLTVLALGALFSCPALAEEAPKIRFSLTPVVGYSQYTMKELNDDINLLSTIPGVNLGPINGGLTYGLRLSIENGPFMAFILPETLSGSTSDTITNAYTGQTADIIVDTKATATSIGIGYNPLSIDNIRNWVSVGYTFYAPSGTVKLISGNVQTNSSLTGPGGGWFVESITQFTRSKQSGFNLGGEAAIGYRNGKFDATVKETDGRQPLDYSGFYVRAGLTFCF